MVASFHPELTTLEHLAISLLSKLKRGLVALFFKRLNKVRDILKASLKTNLSYRIFAFA